MYDDSYAAYRSYLLSESKCELSQEVINARRDLLEDMISNPDYHCDTKRNGSFQPMLLTRGGEQHSYNVICRPGDELFAGDIIDAFGSKWLVMEARADTTTHKTGVMYQCNKLFRFQNFTPEVVERWGIIDISGYSSSLNSDTQLQYSADQVVIYLPYDEDTAKIYIDKRLPSHVGYDKFGNKTLFSFKVTGTSPVSESYNAGDHLLMLKAERFLYAQDKDNLDLEICDYINPSNDQSEHPQEPSLLHCEIIGSHTLRIGSTRTYHAVFRDDLGNEIEDAQCTWSVACEGITVIPSGTNAKIYADYDKSIIGNEFTITVTESGGRCSPAEYQVEVTALV